MRGIHNGTWVKLASRVGETVLKARITTEVPAGVVYTTFHFPESGANVVTTEYSDWATNCPEYKVTAVEISPSLRGPNVVHCHQPAVDPELNSLIRMANQIAENTPKTVAPEYAVALHFDQFWTPAMKARLGADADPSLLSPLVLKALTLQHK